MKGYLDLSIQAPNQWTVLANEKANKTSESDNKETKTYEFGTTKLLPTYLYGLIAGHYMEIKGTNTYKNIPMSLYCRESLFPYLQKLSDFIFECTNLSMKFYEDFFGYPYPFNKYD